MTHPLTDKILDKFGTDDQQFAFELATKWEPTRIYLDDDMRAAADWQLEQVMNWLHDNLGNEIYADAYQEDYDNLRGYIITDSVKDDLHLAMRPTQENN